MILENLEELDKSISIILKGNFTGNRKIDRDTNIVGLSTISEFKVDKGGIENSIIFVLEPFDIKDNNFINIEVYIPMDANKEYILFLRENNTSKEDNIVNQKSNIKY